MHFASCVSKRSCESIDFFLWQEKSTKIRKGGHMP